HTAARELGDAVLLAFIKTGDQLTKLEVRHIYVQAPRDIHHLRSGKLLKATLDIAKFALKGFLSATIREAIPTTDSRNVVRLLFSDNRSNTLPHCTHKLRLGWLPVLSHGAHTCGAGGRDRTGTALSRRGILSPLRLPIPPRPRTGGV